jgi:choline dehydrogenase-like flavoprotein
MLGGTSAMNQSLWQRGTRADYDELASLVGSAEWSWTGLLPYFKKHERLDSTDVPDYSPDFHGKEGVIHVSSNKSQIPIEKDFLAACGEVAGFAAWATGADATSGTRDSFFTSLSTVDRVDRPGTRSHSGSAYLLPNLGRANLKVLTGANVESVRFDRGAGRPTANGVHFWHGRSRYTAVAGKEVIVCAGAYKTPQVLEMSGVGDPKVLQAAGVECIVANKFVGANLTDHHAMAITFELAPGGFSVDAFAIPEVVQQFMELYMKTGTGPLANPPSGMGYLSYAALVSPEELKATLEAVVSAKVETPLSDFHRHRTLNKLADPTAAAIQFLFIPANIDTERGLADQRHFLTPASTGNNHVSVVAAFQYPLSRGSVHITSNDPHVQPAIDNAFLAHPVDVAVLRSALPFLNKVTLVPKIKEQLHPNYCFAQKVGLGDKKKEEAFVRGDVGTEHHPIGTAAMGDVVDVKLKVLGVQGLRVCDASVLPLQISGNPMATIYAFAEKLADLIKAEHA